MAMTTSKIRSKLYEYIRVAEDKKVKAIYTMLEEEIEESHEYWKDKNFKFKVCLWSNRISKKKSIKRKSTDHDSEEKFKPKKRKKNLNI